MIFTGFQYLKYKLTSRHKYGHGIHSPFVYDFIINVLRDKTFYKEYNIIMQVISEVNKDRSLIRVSNLGSKKSDKHEKVCKISKRISVNTKYGRLLLRLIRYYNLRNILELGTGLGISTLYLMYANSSANIVSIEGHKEYFDYASKLLNLHKNNCNLFLINKNIEIALSEIINNSIDFAFVDGNHTYHATMYYFEQLLKVKHSDSIFVFDDINWSNEMRAAWKAIVKHNEVKLSVELFRFGIVFFNENILQKQHFVIRF